MILEIPKEVIFQNLIRQLSSFFEISTAEKVILNELQSSVLRRCEICFGPSENKYYKKEDKIYFNPFHSGQYTIYLYYFSNSIFKNSESKNLADKVYYLNKMMNGCDLFYEVELPEVFMLDHPVGSVMGRAVYGNFFSFAQNCTVGNNRGVYPTIGSKVKMSASSMILGNSTIGNNVIIGAGACIKDQDIPDNSLVFGSSPYLVIKSRKNL